MGRPTFKIDQDRLRALRIEQGLTQIAIVQLASPHASAPNTASRVRHYQRIEETGQTSAGYARTLAGILGVPTSVLQGFGTPDASMYRRNLQKLLREQLDAGSNAALNGMLDHHMQGDADEALEYLTKAIADDIERVLLVRNPRRIAELVALTGMAEADLLAPANVEGFWFLSANARGVDSSEVVNGVNQAGHRIGEIMAAFLGVHDDDSSVRMWRDGPWLRVEVERPRVQDVLCIDLTRCQPDAAGLRWTEASWLDAFFLDPVIVDKAYACADVVTDFSGRASPADLKRLRLVVTEHDKCRQILGKMVVNGGLDALPKKMEEDFARDCSSRVLAMNWLTNGLQHALMPHLGAHAASAWHLTAHGGTSIDINLENPRYPGALSAELKYRIVLAEDTGADTLRRVPVRARDIAALQVEIETWLAVGYIASEKDDPAPAFHYV